MIRRMTITGIRSEELTSQSSGRPYKIWWLKLDNKDKEIKVFDRPYITKDWTVGKKVDLVLEEREFTDDYGEKRTSTSFRVAERNDYLEERVAKLEFHCFGGQTAAQIAAQRTQAPVAPAVTAQTAPVTPANVAQESSTSIDDLPF